LAKEFHFIAPDKRVIASECAYQVALRQALDEEMLLTVVPNPIFHESQTTMDSWTHQPQPAPKPIDNVVSSMDRPREKHVDLLSRLNNRALWLSPIAIKCPCRRKPIALSRRFHLGKTQLINMLALAYQVAEIGDPSLEGMLGPATALTHQQRIDKAQSLVQLVQRVTDDCKRIKLLERDLQWATICL
jgi:hypothetical protein